jgi:hypothetical protein
MSLHKTNIGDHATAQSSSYWSHDAQQTKVPVASRTRQNVPPSAKHELLGANSATMSRNESALSSSGLASASGIASSSGNGVRRGIVKDSRSIVPRSISAPSAARVASQAISTPPPPSSASLNGSRLPVPSGYSHENAIASDNTPKTLRRKAPSVEQYVSSLARSVSYSKPRGVVMGNQVAKRSSKSLPGDVREFNTEVALDIAASVPKFPTMPANRRSGELPPALIPELKALAAATAPSRAASSTPHVPLTGSPSTQYSGSTGPWSSRNTTPSSVSSCSPGIVQASKIKPTHRLRKAIPPQYTTLERPKLGLTGLLAREAAASSPSLEKLSKDDYDKHSLLQQHRKQSKGSLLPPAPTAPPQKSSMKPKPPSGAPKVAPGCAPEDSLSKPLASVPGVAGLLEGVPDVPTSGGESPLRERPRRPSRKGTADLELKSSPIVQSNLSPQSVRGHRRRESLDVGYPGPSGREVASSGSMDIVSPIDPFSHTQHPFPRENIDLASSSSNLPVVRPTPDSSIRVVPTKENGSRQGPNEPARSTLGKLTSRLGIFGRRPKVSREDTSTNENKDPRKGPAAGTGHEGYGKYARRGRKYSMGSVSSSRDRSTSTNSTSRRLSLRRRNSQSSGGESEIDEFVAQRLQPVIIPGGGHPEPRPDSEAPTIWPSFHGTSLGSDSSLDLARQLTNEPPGSVLSNSQSISTTSVATDIPFSMATHSGWTTSSKTTLKHPYAVQTSPSLDGYNTSQSSLTQDDVVGPSGEEYVERSTPRDLKKAGKKGTRFRWNVFQRKASAEQSGQDNEDRVLASTRMAVAVAPVSVERPLPYYALMDSENDNDGENGLQDLLEQVYDSASPSSEPHGLGLRQEYGQSVLLPSMPILQGEALRDAPSTFPRVSRKGDSQPSTAPYNNPLQSADSKRNRLPQVGRIPRVISRRDRQHKPAITSFSRPFQRAILNNAPERCDDHSAERPILGIQTDVLPSRPFFGPESGQPASAPAPSLTTRPLGDFESHPQFLIFAGGEVPDVSTGNNSDEIFAVATHRPTTRHRRHTEEDEIWNEYDDLLDRVMSPTSADTARSAGSLFGQDSAPITADLRAKARPESHLRLGMLPTTGHNAKQTQTPSVHLPPPSPPARTDLDYHLRRSRIVSALHSHSPLSPSSPFSITNYAMESGSHDDTRTNSGEGFSSATAVESGLLSPSAHAPYAAFPKLPEASHHQSTALLDIAERDREGPAGQSDLRFAALMTSRWLSFGRVLFSPAHDVVENNPSQHILVIDGLGNDDWSFYCAVTYPTAVIHDLKEMDVAPGSRREIPTESWRAPPNYRRAELPNLAERFPFPQSYFAAVVFRFPAAMSDTVLKMAFSECKRVLMPGGYIELSLLDLDIVNMGTMTRRAVRDLKARMIAADLDVSLKPVSDNIQNILGRRGFDNLNRCVVGVPVAGKVATSSGSRSSRSSRDSSRQRGKGATDQAGGENTTLYGRSNNTDRPQQRGRNFSLSELVSDHSPTSDEKITKMMAKVGRWWYTRTYEWAVLQGGDLKKSIWSDKRMLHECKARGSNFKLLIAYAQKPIETRRRTMSEPVKSTDAISGTRMMNQFDEEYRSENTR